MTEQKPATEQTQSSKWEVFKDDISFAPPQITRLSKPWERKPVSAHAPRLHGQKIWKKAGSIVKGHSTKENGTAQTELDLEGMGARKRMKGIGEKENISDAKWLLHSNDKDIAPLGIVSPVKKNGLDFDTNALLVPRKRTNANHLVTLRKPDNKIPLQDVTQRSAIKLENHTEPEDMVTDSSSLATTPIRQTKSMRNSFTRLSSDEGVGEAPVTQPESTGEDIKSGLPEDLQSDQARTIMLSQPVDIFGTSSEAINVAHSDAQITEDIGAGSNVMSQLDTLEEEGDEDFGSRQLEIESQETLIPVLSHDASTSAAPLSQKINETPQKKTKSRTSRTPRTSPVKRSTRTTRSSLLPPETMIPITIPETANAKDVAFKDHSPVKAHPISKDIDTETFKAGVKMQATNGEVVSAMYDTTDDTTAVFFSRYMDLAEEPILESNEMEDIQQALNIEGREVLEFELPIIAESKDEISEDSSTDSDSPSTSDLCAPERPGHNIKQTPPGSPILAQSHSHSMDDSPELSEDLEIINEITLSSGQEVESLVSNPILNPSELSSSLDTSTDNPAAVYDRDDTDVLRNFLTRVKADKAAKANDPAPKRKRSLPHSPLQIPLGTIPNVSSPNSPKLNDDVDELALNMEEVSPSKRGNPSTVVGQHELDQPRPARRSGRTRLPVKSAPFAGAPSFIPLRRLGNQAGGNTVTLKRNEEKELATITKSNTRKNKGGATLPPLVLAKKSEEKEDPAAKHKALKEIFDDMAVPKKGNKKGRNVIWAEEIAQFQTAVAQTEPEVILPLGKEEKKIKEKPVVLGMRRSKIAVETAKGGTSVVKKQLKPKKK